MELQNTLINWGLGAWICRFRDFQKQNKKILLKYKENAGVLNIQIIGNKVVKRSVASCFIISPNLNCPMN